MCAGLLVLYSLSVLCLVSASLPGVYRLSLHFGWDSFKNSKGFSYEKPGHNIEYNRNDKYAAVTLDVDIGRNNNISINFDLKSKTGEPKKYSLKKADVHYRINPESVNDGDELYAWIPPFSSQKILLITFSYTSKNTSLYSSCKDDKGCVVKWNFNLGQPNDGERTASLLKEEIRRVEYDRFETNDGYSNKSNKDVQKLQRVDTYETQKNPTAVFYSPCKDIGGCTPNHDLNLNRLSYAKQTERLQPNVQSSYANKTNENYITDNDETQENTTAANTGILGKYGFYYLGGGSILLTFIIVVVLIIKCRNSNKQGSNEMYCEVKNGINYAELVLGSSDLYAKPSKNELPYTRIMGVMKPK